MNILHCIRVNKRLMLGLLLGILLNSLSALNLPVWAVLFCPQDPKQKCYEIPDPVQQNQMPVAPQVLERAPRPPKNFVPDVTQLEIDRAFTVGNPPTGRMGTEAIQLPAFVDEAPNFSGGEYPVCDSDGIQAVCP